MPELKGRTAVVTGATSGIGRATAELLHREGVRLVLGGRREERLREVAEATGATAIAGDVADAAVRRRIVEACGEGPDILVNNAGYSEPGPVETVGPDDYRRQFEVNVFAAAELIRAVLPGMRRRRRGRILNVSSIAGRFGYPLFGWYCASKHAVEGLSDSLRLEVAPWNVHVAVIEPGPIRTEFFDVARKRAAPYLEHDGSPYAPFFAHADEIERDFLKHAGEPDDVARTILAACRAERPRDRYAVTGMARASILSVRLLPRRWLDAFLRKQFRIPGAEEVE